MERKGGYYAHKEQETNAAVSRIFLLLSHRKVSETSIKQLLLYVI